ncbi:MAG: class I SAM-dependent methyltransferase, partial [Alphaproteobacteria bacterium]
MTFRSGNREVDRYIAAGYETVRGMSSAFAATICGHIIRRQSELGITGHIAEIGTFEGRFFIAMALGLAPGERALGIDTFNWPNEGLLDLFHSHCARHGLARERYSAIKANVRDLSAGDIQTTLGGPVRFWHLDGDHSREQLSLDLALAESTLHSQGIICLDDMLHPGYPLLVVAVHEWLEQHPDWRVLCVIDREDIVAAAKFLLCHKDVVPLFEQDLMDTFKAQHWVLGSEWERY